MTDPILAYIGERLHKHRQHAPRAPRDCWSTAAIAAHYAVDTELKSLIRNIMAGEHIPVPGPQAQDFQKLTDEIEAETLNEGCPFCGVSPREACFTKIPCTPHEGRLAVAGYGLKAGDPVPIHNSVRISARAKKCPLCLAPAGVSCQDYVSRDPVD